MANHNGHGCQYPSWSLKKLATAKYTLHMSCRCKVCKFGDSSVGAGGWEHAPPGQGTAACDEARARDRLVAAALQVPLHRAVQRICSLPDYLRRDKDIINFVVWILPDRFQR